MNLVNTEYITTRQFIDDLKGDLKKYSENGIIDESTLYKVIAYTNAIAGIRINPIECAVLDVEDYMANLPEAFKKMKNAQVMSNFKVASSLGFYKNWTETVTKKPDETTPLYTPMGCINDCGQCYYVVPYKQAEEQHLVFTEYHNLHPVDHNCKKDSYKINREENIIEFGIKQGKVFLTYYADMDVLGLIPKQPQLYLFYEWSLKVKIFQDILMNSEDDIVQKLQYAEKQMQLAYIDFDNYIKSISFKKALQIYNKRQEEHYNTWVLPFN